MKKNNWLLILILILGAVLRLVWISKYPAGFTPDEADQGYNGYSILKTGKDEWGTPWWKLTYQNMRSFGDYKLPLYSFMTVPSIAVFGLNEFAVRLPGALFGIFAIAGVYYLAEALFPNKKISLLSAFILCISPWHISLSRGAFEANLITFFLPWAIYLFLKNKYTFSAVVLAISLYSYHTVRYLAPIYLIILLSREKFKLDKKMLISAFVFAILAIPAGISMLGTGSTRAADISILSSTDNWQGVAARRYEARNLGLPDSLARIFSNKVIAVATNFGHNYLGYLSPDFLFISGAAEASHGLIPGRGVMYVVELLFIVGFLIALIKTKSPTLILIGLLIIVAPIPASLSKGNGHATNRSASMIPFLSIATASGIIYFADNTKKYQKLFWPAVVCIYFVSLSFFLEDYVYHAPRINAPAMSYGWAELMTRLPGIAADYDQVKISRSLSEPQVFVAFYLPIPPEDFQREIQKYSDFSKSYKFLDQQSGVQIGKYWFGDIHPQDPDNGKTLFVGPSGEFPTDFPEYFHIDYPSGKTAIKVAHGI